MSTLNTPAVANRYVHSVREAIEARGGALGCVVLSDDDPTLLDRLAAAMDSTQTLVLPAPQASWSKGGSGALEALVWAVAEAAIDWIVLVGNSAARQPDADDGVFCRPGADAAELVRTANERREQAQRRYAAEVNALLDKPGVRERVDEGALRLHTLYYRAESGVFAAYCRDADEFRPLAG